MLLVPPLLQIASRYPLDVPPRVTMRPPADIRCVPKGKHGGDGANHARGVLTNVPISWNVVLRRKSVISSSNENVYYVERVLLFVFMRRCR